MRRVAPVGGSVLVALLRAEDPEALCVVHGELAAEVDPLVVELDGIALDAVLDAHAFLAFFEVADDLTSEVVAHLAAGRHGLSEEAHDVRAAEGGHSMVDQRWVAAFQRRAVAKGDVGGPLALVRRPVVGDGVFLEDLVVLRVDHTRELVQQLGPIHGELLVHQALRLGEVLDHGKEFSQRS